MSFCKYLGINVPILMFDGEIKMSQDIRIGDEIMGDDSTPRRVLLTYQGEEMKLFRIIPRFSKSFVVGEFHDLLVTNNDRKSFLINIKNFFFMTDKNNYQLNNIFINYPTKFIPIPPYIFGLLIANNKITENIASINVENINIKNYVENTFKNLEIKYVYDELETSIHITDKLVLTVLNNVNINVNSIPEYLINNDTIILSKFLAGIIDVLGKIDMQKNCYILENILEKVINDLVKICNTLGFHCISYKSKVPNYKTIHIYGTYITDLPILSDKKLQKQDLVNDFRIASLNEGKYVAIKINNGRFICLGDSTIL